MSEDPGSLARPSDEAEWFYDDGAQARGPFTLKAICQMARAGVVRADIPVARLGDGAWRPLSDSRVEAGERGIPPTVPTGSEWALQTTVISWMGLLGGLSAGAKVALGVAASVALIVGINLAMPRDIMDTPFDRSSERAFQASYARFEKEATPEQSQALAGASGTIGGLIFMGGQIPDDTMRYLCRGYWPVRATVWETFGGHTPNEIIGFGAEVLRRANQPQ